MNYVEIAIPFFVLAMGIEFLYGILVGRQTYRVNDTVNSLALGVFSQLNVVLRLGVTAVGFGVLVDFLGVPQWSMDSTWQWVVAFVAYDFCYYWKHRAGHRSRIFWASHIAHHQSEEFNLSTALRQTGTDYIGFVFYLPLYFVGIPPAAVVTVGSLNLIYQFWVHTEHVRRLGMLDRIFVTPSNHRVHHARNAEYIDKNYGGVFILWDRLFGTFKDERADAPCIYGITTGLKSFNPLWANFHYWIDTFQVSRRTRRWADKIKVWFMPPGWFPADVEPPPSKDWRYPKFDPPATAFVRGYTLTQFWLITAASLWLLKAYGELPTAFVLSAFVWICFSLYVQGVWLEGRQYAGRLEWLRIATGLVLAMALQAFWPKTLSVAALILGSYSIASAFAVALERMLGASNLKSA